jgi:hypothetical protein
MSLFTQWVPSEWASEPHTEELEAYTDRLIDLYDEVAPGFKGSILHRDIIGPHEMEVEYGLIGGNIFHGELSLEQLFHMRPAPGFADYRTPIAGLYNGSSATHAGGGVCGIPGWQAARAALADQIALFGQTPQQLFTRPGRARDAPLRRAPALHCSQAARWGGAPQQHSASWPRRGAAGRQGDGRGPGPVARTASGALNSPRGIGCGVRTDR